MLSDDPPPSPLSFISALDTFSSANTSISSHSAPDSSEPIQAPSPALSLKRAASPEFDDDEQDPAGRKRLKENMEHHMDVQAGSSKVEEGDASVHIDGQALADDLAQELQCGCCAELVYKPVVVAPCDHFFCGSCCTLWIQNGGTNCPACRGVSTGVTPSRAIQAMVDVLLRAAPHRERTARERTQADEVYPVLRNLRLPVPREPSPDPAIPPNPDVVPPCPHCAPHNAFGYTCPTPVPDGWRAADGPPPGHAHCGNCEILLALGAPSTSRCSFCAVAFCGLAVPGRCNALPLGSQHPHGFRDVSDLIQSAEVYDAFEAAGAAAMVEVELMLDYMTAHNLGPKHIYRQIAAYYASQPNGFAPLVNLELFADIHSVAPAPPLAPTPARSSSPGGEPTSEGPVQQICRLCATEVMLFGLRDWWLRERARAVREGILPERRDCPRGMGCEEAGDPGHAKEFNHLILPHGFPGHIPTPHPEPGSSSRPPISTPSSSSTSSLSAVGPGSSASSSTSHSHSSSNNPSPSRYTLPSLAELGIPPPSFNFAGSSMPASLPTSMSNTMPIPPFGSFSSSLPHPLFTRESTGVLGLGNGSGGSNNFTSVVSPAPNVPPEFSIPPMFPRAPDSAPNDLARDRMRQRQNDQGDVGEPPSFSSTVDDHLANVLSRYDSDPEPDGDANFRREVEHMWNYHLDVGTSQSDFNLSRHDDHINETEPERGVRDAELSNREFRDKERRVDDVLEARYNFALAQSRQRLEEAEADLASIRREQAKLGLEMDSDAPAAAPHISEHLRDLMEAADAAVVMESVLATRALPSALSRGAPSMSMGHTQPLDVIE